jgi:hypothetical protein
MNPQVTVELELCEKTNATRILFLGLRDFGPCRFLAASLAPLVALRSELRASTVDQEHSKHNTSRLDLLASSSPDALRYQSWHTDKGTMTSFTLLHREVPSRANGLLNHSPLRLDRNRLIRLA